MICSIVRDVYQTVCSFVMKLRDLWNTTTRRQTVTVLRSNFKQQVMVIIGLLYRVTVQIMKLNKQFNRNRSKLTNTSDGIESNKSKEARRRSLHHAREAIRHETAFTIPHHFSCIQVPIMRVS